MIHPSAAVLEYQLVSYRRTWRGTVFSSFLLPLLFLLAMGKSVGRYVDAGGGLDVPYLAYIAPGVLVATALQVGVMESSYPVYSAFTWDRTYYAMLATPLRVVDVLIGQLAYVALRLAVAALGFWLVMVAFGTVGSAWGGLVPLVAILVGLAVASPVLAYTATIRSEGLFPVLFRFGVIPMTLFAGVFFPVELLPALARPLAYASPLWHGVELSRAATLGLGTGWGVPAHLGYLLLWFVGGFLLAHRAFVRKLRDGGGG